MYCLVQGFQARASLRSILSPLLIESVALVPARMKPRPNYVMSSCSTMGPGGDCLAGYFLGGLVSARLDLHRRSSRIGSGAVRIESQVRVLRASFLRSCPHGIAKSKVVPGTPPGTVFIS